MEGWSSLPFLYYATCRTMISNCPQHYRAKFLKSLWWVISLVHWKENRTVGPLIRRQNFFHYDAWRSEPSLNKANIFNSLSWPQSITGAILSSKVSFWLIKLTHKSDDLKRAGCLSFLLTWFLPISFVWTAVWLSYHFCHLIFCTWQIYEMRPGPVMYFVETDNL